MKHLLNVPLAIGALAQLIFASLALMSGPWAGWEDGPSRGAMAYMMFQPAALAWLMLLVAACGAVFTDAYTRAPVAHPARRRLAALALSLLVVATLGVCMIVALSASPAVGSHDNDEFNTVLVAIARIGGIAGPLAAMGWLAWLVDAPPPRRHDVGARYAIFAGFTLTTIAGGVIGVQMLAEEIAIDRETAARNQEMIDQRAAENQAALRTLDDASPIVDWLRLTDPLQTADIRDAALHRLVKRPTLDHDLGQSLQSSDAIEADWALHAFVLLDFKPSAVLEAPLRTNFAALGERIAVSRQTPGGGLDDPGYLDRWFGEQLAQSLAVTEKMAESAGVDLRDADRRLAAIVAQNYPDSNAAKTFPRKVDALGGRIDKTLAAHKPP